MYCTNSIQSNDKLEQTSSKQHYLLINLCLKINATGNPECTLFNSECTISAGNTLRIGTVAYTYNRRSLIKLHSSPVQSTRSAQPRPETIKHYSRSLAGPRGRRSQRAPAEASCRAVAAQRTKRLVGRACISRRPRPALEVRAGTPSPTACSLPAFKQATS